eukprot:PLAT3100.1.p1 GENE.PLAT3100.1~~PLAT3100.1.p1  ORF type:complete len:249 (+),score=48.68 PLAT3100.1:26-748(+)
MGSGALRSMSEESDIPRGRALSSTTSFDTHTPAKPVAEVSAVVEEGSEDEGGGAAPAKESDEEALARALLVLKPASSAPVPALAILDCMKEHADDAAVAAVALASLDSMVAGKERVREMLAEADGIELSVKAMQAHSTNDSVQIKGCAFLAAMCGDYADRVVSAGGIVVVLEAMAAGMAWGPEVHTIACRALTAFASMDGGVDKLKEAGAVEAVNASKAAFDEAMLQYRAENLLALLSAS